MREQNGTIDAKIEQMRQTISINIKLYRKERRISQQKLADLAGLHRTYISDLENGKSNPTLTVMMVVAECLNVELKDLLGFDK